MNITLGKKIQSLRKEKKLCQTDLCCKILSRTILSKIENDKVTPSIFQLKHISHILNVSIDYLLDNNYISSDSNTVIAENNQSSILYNLYIKKDYNSITTTYERGLIDVSKDLNFLFYVGSAYCLTEFYNYSAQLLKKYIKIYSTLSDNIQKHYAENVATALNLLCKKYSISNDYKKSIICISQAKNILQKHDLKNTTIYHLIIYNLGHLYNLTNEYTKTIKLLESYLSNNLNLIYLKVFPYIHLNLNIAHYNLGNYEKSIQHIKHAIILFDYIEEKNMTKNCYLNYINSLRYCYNFNKAFKILEEFKDSHWNDLNANTKINFLMQEIILYYNINDYETALNLLNKFNLNQLDSYNRNTYYFIQGHIQFINKNYNQAYASLLKCEKYFVRHHYTYDLISLYSDLYQIDNNNEFKIKLEQCKKSTSNSKKNIHIY